MDHFPWLSWLVFFPLVGAMVVVLAPERLARTLATLFAAAETALALPLWWRMSLKTSSWQFAEHRAWIPQWGASYSLAVDGLSVLLVLLTVVLSLIAIVGAFSAVDKRAKEFFALLLALETGMIGTFLATDVLLFYVFWEAMLIPMYLLIGVWGGQRRVYAAIKFFLYTMAGSVLMLAAILWMYFHYKSVMGVASFSLDAWYTLPLAPATQLWLFLAFALAFAIKVPMFPFHTWLPDAHVEAPTAGSVILAAVLLKMGTYGFIRFAMPLFPNASALCTPWIVALSLIGIVYGALVAMVQPDMKKLVAYSSVSHLGFVMLGLYAMNTQGVTGAMLQMLNHGVSTGALFMLVGVIYERRHTRKIEDFGGLWKPMPVYAAVFMVVMLSSVGLPSTNGFVGEFLVLLGAFRNTAWWAAVGATGVILSALYMLWMYQRVMFGPVTHAENEKLSDLNSRERLVFVPILLLIFWMGVVPQPFIDRMAPSIEHTLELSQVRMHEAQSMAVAPPARHAPVADLVPGGAR
ncbi:MAG: NADH-quinone oxidoreductase subunit M [Candidatus Eisenbacteria bacterium]